jgi:hypothetical protein
MLKNYHEYSKKLEDKYNTDLLEKYSPLLLLLNDIKKLNKSNINDVIVSWKKEYWQDIEAITLLNIQKIDKYTNTLITGDETERQQSVLIDGMVLQNMRLLDQTTENIRQRFTELGVLENGAYSAELATKNVQGIVNSVEKSLDLFAVMSTMGNMRELIFGNAESVGWEQYQWRTQRDSRVRPTHAAMDNRWINIDDLTPQPAGCPVSQDYNCRCWAINFRKRGSNSNWIYLHN